MGITILIFFILYMLDQVSKFLVELYITKGPITVIPNFLIITKTYNTGAAFSFLENHTWVLVLISALATVLIAVLASKNDWKHSKLASFSITMALAGCVGNFFDRLISIIPGLKEMRPGVVDMITLKPFDWLTNLITGTTTIFNVADMYLVLGLIIFAIDYIFFSERRALKYAEANNQ